MYPFVAFLWNSRDPGAAATAARLSRALQHAACGWIRSFSAPCMAVFTRHPVAADLRQYPLPEASGVVLGRLFPAALEEITPAWRPSIVLADSRRLLETAGRALIQRYWGTYVAFLASSRESHCCVIRDPSGALSCHRTHYLGVDIICADVNDLADLPLPPFNIDPAYLAASIYRDSIQVRATALREVTELLAGECFERRGSAVRQHLVWDPTNSAGSARHWSHADAAQRLRDVTQACVDAWATAHPRILHCLSGGLDSAILLGCLHRSRFAPAVVGLNQHTDWREGDERRYARMAAARACIPLCEERWDPNALALDERLLEMPLSAKPSFSRYARLLQIPLTQAAARRADATAIWKGHGGDHLFLKSTDISCVADFVLDHGIRPGLIHVIAAAAHGARRPYLLVVQDTLAQLRGGHERAPRAAGPLHFVRREALPDPLDRYTAHPWMESAANLPPGRQAQIAMLVDVIHRHRTIPGREPIREHHPLLSQPIVELCLAVPTYQHLTGGRHRALARDAFADYVPGAILEREDKGDTTRLVIESVRGAEPFLAGLLMDGILAREAVIDRAQVEDCLCKHRALYPAQLPALLAAIAAELWARKATAARGNTLSSVGNRAG